MLIGLGFRARSGKDTVGEYLEKYQEFTRVAFADSLKKACWEIFGLTDQQLYGDLKETEDQFWKATPRHILQQVGTECMRRGYSDDIWIKSLQKRISRLGKLNIVVTDVRFPNEAEAIHAWGGKVVRVERPSAPGIATSQHASETSMLDYEGWDYYLHNDGDLPQLYANVEIMMNTLKVKS